MAVRLPGPDEDLSSTSHIKPLFRSKDRAAMHFAFDPWSVQDVSRHADAILTRLRAGTMPCDGAWPAERIEAFERWSAAGAAPCRTRDPERETSWCQGSYGWATDACRCGSRDPGPRRRSGRDGRIRAWP
jgi:hypothetical protein